MKTFVKILSMIVAVVMLVGVGVVGLTAYAEPSDVLGEYDFTVVDNPYENIQWNNGTLHAFKSSTHAHTVRSDGDIELNDTIWEHYMKGYEVLCLTDHGTVNGVDIDDAISGKNTGARYENGYSCGWTEDQTRCTLYGYQSFVHGNVDEITESDYYDIIKGVSRDGRPQALVQAGRGMFNLPLGNEVNANSTNKCHVNTYNVSHAHGANKSASYPDVTVRESYSTGAYSRINHVGEWTDGNGDPNVYSESWVQEFAGIFQTYCPNRTTYTESDSTWNVTNVTGQKVKKGVIGIELVNTSDNRTRNDRFYVYDASLKILAPQGINMYGFCEDDSHEESDVNKNAQYFLVNDGTAWSEEDKAYYGQHYGQRNGLDPWVGYTGDITKSMTNGEFYASSVNSKNSYELGDGFVASGEYPALKYFDIDAKEGNVSGSNQITLKVTNASKVRLVADGNIIATKTISESADETTVTFDLNSYENQINSYIRIYMTGKGGISYLQPILLSKSENKQSYVKFELPSKDTTLSVYDSNGALVNTEYTDNIFVLSAGTYKYVAERKGYYTKEESFTVTQAEIDAGTQKTITVELEKDDRVSQLYFYAPETIYLDPADNKTFKYYVDRENAEDGALITSANKTEGNVYFYRKGATNVTLSATYQEGAAVSVSSYSLGLSSTKGDTIKTQITDGSLSQKISGSDYVLISWKAEYTFEGKDYTAYTYSYVYAAPDPNTKTLGAGAWARTNKAAGWMHSTMQVVSTVYAYGFHKVETVNANGYRFAPYYYTGDTAFTDDPAISGAGYAWNGDDSSGGSRDMTATGGTGTIYADVSRNVNGFEDIPLFTFGMDINDAMECDEGGAYITFSLTGGGISHTLLDLSNFGGLTKYDGQRVYLKNNATSGSYSMAFNTADTVTYTLLGKAYGYKSDRHDSTTSIIYITVVPTDKEELRRLYNESIANCYQQDWFESTDEFNAYRDKVIAAAKVLGNPAASQDDIDTAANNLAGASINLKSGTAQVKHYWVYNNQTGEMQVEAPYSYTISDVLVANATEITGFTYAKKYERIVDDRVIVEGSTEFESITSVEDNYTWIFYYRPNTYAVSYYTGTDNFNPTGAAALAVYNQDYKITTASPTRAGYVFQGWYLDIDPNFTVYASGDTIKYSYMDNGQFIAKWDPRTYSVTYDLNGGSFKANEGPTAEELSVVYDQTYTITTAVPEREGYYFVGWKVNGGETHTSGSQFTWDFASNGTLEAQWSNIAYNVTLNPNASNATVDQSSVAVYYDMAYGTLPAAHRTGYTYEWYANPQFPENALVTAETIVKIPADHELWAKWTPIEYTISYNLDGGSVSGVNPTTYNVESDPITLIYPTKTGYEFVGWLGTDLSNTSYTKDVTIPTGSTGNREYKANWKAVVYTINYDLNYDAGTASVPTIANNPTSYTINDDVTILPPTRAGYEFAGWSGDGYSNVNTITIPAGTLAKNLSLTAEWHIVNYTITYDTKSGAFASGASHPSTYTIETGFTVSDPVKDGYDFQGWQSYAFDGIEKNLTRPAGTYGNFELVAVWSGTEGEIIYNLNGGKVVGKNPTAYQTGDSYTLTNPTKAGYTFVGWNKYIVNENKTETGIEMGINPTDTGTIIFTAMWSATNYEISYDLDGGRYENRNSGNPANYSAETETFTLINPVKEGYIFAGWTGTGISGTSKSVTVQKGSTGDREYKANWNYATYTITYDYAGGASDASHILSYTMNTETHTINPPVRAGYSFAGWTQTIQNFTWKPGELNELGDYQICEQHYLSSPILVRTGHTYTINSNGYAEYIDAYFFDENRNFVTKVDVETAETLSLPSNGLTGDKYFVYFVVSEVFLDVAFRESISISVVNDEYKIDGTGKQHTVVIPKGSTGNMKLVASWNVETYNITYDLDGGYYKKYDDNGNLVTGYNPNPSTFNVDSGEILIQNPVKDGYTFIAWECDGVRYPTVIIKQGSSGSRHYKALWAETMYSIKYDLGGGVVAENNRENYYHSTETFTLNNPTREGYTFGGWMGTGINGTSFDVTIPKGSTGNREYTATWTPDTYNISYTLNGGVNASSNPYTYTYETETFTLAQPTKAGAAFAGWTGTDLESATATVTIHKGSSGNRAYEATWVVSNYNISYNLAGGINSEKNPLVYTVDTETFTLERPTRTGYTFAGWTGTDLDQVTEYVTIPKGSTGNRIYTAVWTPIVYGISYVLGSGAQVGVANPTSYTIETSTFTLNNPVRAGYIFQGWTGTNVATPTQTVTVYRGSIGTRSYEANWELEEYHITYVLNGGVADGNPEKYTINSPTFTLKAPTRTGYEFVAWSGTGITGSGFATEVTVPSGSTGNRTYTANWKVIEYSISYDLDGGTETIKNPVKYTFNTANITLHNPEKPGYIFVGWLDLLAEDATPVKTCVIPSNSTGDKSYKAVWEKGVYNLTFNLDGGSWTDFEAPETYIYEDEITVPNPVKEGFTFVGWSGTGISGTATDIMIPYGSSGDRTYTAHWSESENVITYNGLTESELIASGNPTSYTTDSGYLSLNAPKRNGYRFDGWTGSNGTEPEQDVEINTSIGGALEFTANWTVTKYRISYVLNGGTATNVTTYTVEDQFTLNNPVRTGYTFKGWTGTGLDGVQPSVTVLKGSTGVRSYTAVWEETVYKISYDYGNGSVDAGNLSEYSYTTPTFALNNPTCPGYTFIGWTGTGLDGMVMTVLISKGSTGDRSYTAHYAINSFTIRYLDVEGATFTGAPTTYTPEDVVTIPNPSKVGYIFEGWSGPGFSGTKKDVVIAKGSEGNRVYTAVWTPVEYAITYELNSGRVSGINPSSYNIESADISILNPGRAGFAFKGWTKTLKDFTWNEGTIDSTGAYVSGNGYYSNLVSLTKGETYTFADGIAIAVYKLDGTFVTLATSSYTAAEDCYCAVVVTGGNDLDAVTVTATGVMEVNIPNGSMGNIHLEAIWGAQTYTITYNLNGGELAQGVTNPAEYTAETPDFKLNNPIKTGYIFNGWTGTELSAVTKDVTVKTGSSGNRTYTANWKVERFILSIELDGGSWGSATPPAQYFAIDTPSFSLPIPVKSGFTFTGWLDSEGTLWKTVTISKGTTGNKSFTAQWEENTEGTHKFYYYGFNNQLLGVVEAKIGAEPAIVSPQQVIGYKFNGWSVDLTNTEVLNSPDDVHVYSKYTIGTDVYSITVWVDGSSKTTSYSQYATVKVTAAATSSDGKAFSHWAVADENGNATGTVVSYYQSFSFKAHADTNLVAVYGATESVDKVTTRITKAEYNAEHRWISFYAERSVDSAYTLIQHGIMFTDDAAVAGDDSAFVLGKNKVYASTASSTSRSGVYTLSIGGLESDANTPYAGCEKLYARSYIIYRDANGNTKTIYSDVSSFTDGINCLDNSAKTSKSI